MQKPRSTTETTTTKSPLKSSHAPRKNTISFCEKKSLQQLQVILSRIIAGIMSQCDLIITYNFLRAKSPQLLPSSRQQHRHCHARDTRNTTEHSHTHVSPHWRPRSDDIIKPTVRIWLTHGTDGQDLTNSSNRRPRSDQMIIILPIKSLPIGRS